MALLTAQHLQKRYKDRTVVKKCLALTGERTNCWFAWA